MDPEAGKGSASADHLHLGLEIANGRVLVSGVSVATGALTSDPYSSSHYFLVTSAVEALVVGWCGAG